MRSSFPSSSARGRAVGAAALVLAGAVGAAGCAPDAPAVAACDYCRMAIESPGYEGMVETSGGRRYRFDAIECLAAAVLTDSVPPGDIRAIRARAVAPPHSLLDARRARFLQSPALHSPMGLNFSGYAGEAEARTAQRRHGGRLLDWRGVLAAVDSLWFRGALDVERHAGLPAAPAQPRRPEASSRR